MSDEPQWYKHVTWGCMSWAKEHGVAYRIEDIGDTEEDSFLLYRLTVGNSEIVNGYPTLFEAQKAALVDLNGWIVGGF